MEKGILPGGAVSGRWEAAIVVQGVLGEEQSRSGWVGKPRGGDVGRPSPGTGSPRGARGPSKRGEAGAPSEGCAGTWGHQTQTGQSRDAPRHGSVLPALAAPGPRAQELIQIRDATSPAPLPSQTHAWAAPAAELPVPHRPRDNTPQGTRQHLGCPHRTPGTRPCCALSPPESRTQPQRAGPRCLPQRAAGPTVRTGAGRAAAAPSSAAAAVD